MIEDVRPAGYRSGTGDNIHRSFFIRFGNGSMHEIAEVDVRFRIKEGSKTTYLSKPLPVRKFIDTGCFHRGSLLPHNHSNLAGTIIAFDHPSALWNTASHDEFEIVGVQYYAGDQDLRDTGHLFSWMSNHKGQEVIAKFAAHPELLHVQDADNVSAFLIAFSCCDVLTLNYMASHGCKWADRCLGGLSTAHFAAVNNSSDLALAVSHLGMVDPKSERGITPLMKAIEYGNADTVSWLLQHKANPSALNSGLLPVAKEAIDGNRPKLLDLLVKAGADRKYHDLKGNGWLHYAARNGNTTLLAKIVGYGVPVDDHSGRGAITPLMAAAETGRSASVIWLVLHGANPDSKDAAGLTAYDHAKFSNTLHTDRFFREVLASAKKKKK